jgi:hypothetical protein
MRTALTARQRKINLLIAVALIGGGAYMVFKSKSGAGAATVVDYGGGASDGNYPVDGGGDYSAGGGESFWDTYQMDISRLDQAKYESNGLAATAAILGQLQFEEWEFVKYYLAKYFHALPPYRVKALSSGTFVTNSSGKTVDLFAYLSALKGKYGQTFIVK